MPPAWKAHRALTNCITVFGALQYLCAPSVLIACTLGEPKKHPKKENWITCTIIEVYK